MPMAQGLLATKPLIGQAYRAFCKPKVGGSIPSSGTSQKTTAAQSLLEFLKALD